MNKMEEKILRKNLGLSEEEFERLKKEGVMPERKEQKRLSFVTTTKPIPPKEKSKIISTHDLNSNGKLIREQRYWDKEKTMKKPAFVTSDVALSESEEGDLKRAEVMEEIKREKEKK